jgi:hypothetical protein
LPQQVSQVSNADLVELAERYLQPWQQTAGWYFAGSKPLISAPRQRLSLLQKPGLEPQDPQAIHPPGPASIPGPEWLNLGQDFPLLLQDNPAATAVFASLVIDGNQWQGSSYLQGDNPLWGVSSLSTQCLPKQLQDCLVTLLGEADKLQPDVQSSSESLDPATRLNGMFESMLAVETGDAATPAIRLAVLVGKLEPTELDGVKLLLSQMPGPSQVTRPPLQKPQSDASLDWPDELAQAQLGYVVNAPLPTAPDYFAWRVLQYILAHDYEGRLGKQAISNSGLAYYIDSQYRSDGQRGWISLGVGVDPAKLAALDTLFREQLTGLSSSPPTQKEVDEAKQHLVGRLATARQSNSELATGLAEQWIWYGSLLSKEEQIARINKLDRQQVLAIIPAFSQGAYAAIRPGKANGNVTD